MEHTNFYNFFSLYYDKMTHFEKRVENEKNFFKKLRNRYNFKTALDIGCGTGAHSLILASLGVQTIGIDPSKGMIEKAKQNIQNIKGLVFLEESLEDHAKKNDTTYDAAFCMGNSLAHIIDKSQLELFIKSLKKIMSKNSIFVLQVLNYEKIFKEKERIINIRETDGYLFIRFYDFLNDNELNFNILIIQKESGIIKHELITSKLYGYTYSQLIDIFKKYNFDICEVFGDLNMNTFSIDISQNLIIILKTK